MPNRIQTLAALSRETGQRIVSSPEEWQAFLRAAARLYKYPFEEQLLIYAQRPDATACAKIEQWNKSVYHRWVKPGAKGIALIDTTGAYPRLKYVFDAADTRETPYSRPYSFGNSGRNMLSRFLRNCKTTLAKLQRSRTLPDSFTALLKTRWRII